MQAAKVPLNEYEFPSNKIANVQSQLEKLVEKNYYLHQSARDAYRYAALRPSVLSIVSPAVGRSQGLMLARSHPHGH